MGLSSEKLASGVNISNSIRVATLLLPVFIIFSCGESSNNSQVNGAVEKGREVESLLISASVPFSREDKEHDDRNSFPDQGSTSIIYQVPITAVFADREGYSRQYVWVVNPTSRRVNQREVEVKRYSASGAEITRGLHPGDHIVLSDVHSLNEGDLVNVTSNL